MDAELPYRYKDIHKELIVKFPNLITVVYPKPYKRE